MCTSTTWKRGALLLMFVTAVPALPTRPILKRHELLEPSMHDDVGGGKDLDEALRALESEMHSLERILANERYDYFYPSHGHKTGRSTSSSRAMAVHSASDGLERTHQKIVMKHPTSTKVHRTRMTVRPPHNRRAFWDALKGNSGRDGRVDHLGGDITAAPSAGRAMVHFLTLRKVERGDRHDTNPYGLPDELFVDLLIRPALAAGVVPKWDWLEKGLNDLDDAKKKVKAAKVEAIEAWLNEDNEELLRGALAALRKDDKVKKDCLHLLRSVRDVEREFMEAFEEELEYQEESDKTEKFVEAETELVNLEDGWLDFDKFPEHSVLAPLLPSARRGKKDQEEKRKEVKQMVENMVDLANRDARGVALLGDGAAHTPLAEFQDAYCAALHLRDAEKEPEEAQPYNMGPATPWMDIPWNWGCR